MKTITKKAYGKNIKITNARDNFNLTINNAKGNTEQDGEPTPDVPIEIKSVALSEIKACGKNLADKSKFTTGKIVDYKNGSIVSYTNYFITDYIEVTAGKTYAKQGVSLGNDCWVYDKNKNPIRALSGEIVTIPNNAKYIVITGKVANIDIVQFEENSVVTEYEPYTESVATLSNPITLNRLNGVQDYVDAKRGVEHYEFKEVVFNGSESGWKQSSTYNTRYYINLSDSVKNGTVLCTQGIRRDSTINGSIRIDGNLNFSIDTTFTTLDEWKAHLASNPMKVTYELAEPIETPLPDADVEALKSLKTYDGVTHIFTDSEVEPELEVEYVLLEVKDEWKYTDYFQFADYNRIAGNINYLKSYLDTLFLGLTNISTMEEKTAKSLIYAREINAIETALEQLNLETYKFDIGEIKEYMANTRTLNFEDLNRIESAIFMLAEQMTSHKENLTRLAFTLGNQKGIRV